MSSEKGEAQRGARPDVVLRGRNGTYLSMWLSGNKLKISVTRRGQDGKFERVDDYVLNLDYMLFVAIRKGDSRGIVGNVCDMLESLAEESESEASEPDK